MRRAGLTLMLLVTMCGNAAVSQAQAPRSDRPDECRAMPSNIHVAAVLRSAVDRLIVRSETIRRQCASIAAATSVTVIVRPMTTSDLRCRAKATIRRYAFGALRAVIEIPMPSDYAELLAHELEHVIEQIEGTDLAARAAMSRSGVEQIGNGVYETARARLAGLSAASEARQARRMIGAPHGAVLVAGVEATAPPP